MEIVTIACPILMKHPEVNPLVAPIWMDKSGNKYYIASGILPDVTPTDTTQANPKAITIVSGPDGFTALSIMGLTPIPEVI